VSGQEPAGTGIDRRIADRYRLTSVIGSGGGGTVWNAVDEMLGREVAIKDVVTPPWLDDGERELVRERTLREARAACLIDHPNVVDIYDVVEQDGRPWIIMRLVRAPSLAQLVEREGPCTPGLAARIGLQVLAALQAAHAHGILHRDVKPSNVLVDGDRALLTDFGIATIAGEATLTSPNALVGAPGYIAPERVHGEPASPASDLWSFGATLYTAVEGRPPHQREGVIATLTAVATDEPDPPKRAGALAPLLTALLGLDPVYRPSAEDVELFLRRVVSLTDADEETVLAPAMAAATALVGLPMPTGTPMEAVQHGEQTRGTRRRLAPMVALLTMAAAAVVLGVVNLLPQGFVDSPVLEQLPGGDRPEFGVPATTIESGADQGDGREAGDPPRMNEQQIRPPVQPAAESGQPSRSTEPSQESSPAETTTTDTSSEETTTSQTDDPPPPSESMPPTTPEITLDTPAAD
jgi:tRNA A-37 threonylcarbamoyl transferase component Bud32